MKLPHGDRGQVSEQKLRDYLLSLSHPVGRSKARFFRALGFDASQLDHFRSALLNLARHEEVETVEATPYGTKYIVTGPLQTPTGLSPLVRTVWIVEEGNSAPQLVTAYPAQRRT
jgi:chromatin segregation and condensation protein Rec8/ScpA/Scc1 (kleisin family)